MPTVIDLFAGAGGLSLGAARAGFNVGAAVELDSHAIASHSANFPNTVHIQRDITTLDGNDILATANIPQNDLIGIIGGPPCQGFSNIGHGNVDDIRNLLFVRFFELVEQLQPIFFVAENVPGIMNDKYAGIRQQAFNHIPDYTILDPITVVASEYGAATTRTRIFFIGYRDDARIMPLTVEDFICMKVPVNERTNVRQALEGLPQRILYTPDATGAAKLSGEYIRGPQLQSNFFYDHVTQLRPNGVGNADYVQNYENNHIFNGHIPTLHTDAVKKRFAKLRYDQQDKISKSKRLNPDKYCPTLRAGTGPEKGSYQAVRPIHYKYSRVITPREAARLQGFPDWYMLPDTIWHGFRHIGNSVSPIVAERILMAIYQKLIL